MKLFGKENDIIKRILNLILIIWLIGSIIISFRIMTNLIFDYNAETYEVYESDKCVDTVDYTCKNTYMYDKTRMKIDKNQEAKNLLFAVSNTVIVGCSIFFINKSNKKKINVKAI